MAERSFKSWQGEDLTPEFDFTEPSSNVHVIWPEVEVGGRAWKGEADVGSVPLRDERGETGNQANLPAGLSLVSLAAHNRWQWTENTGADTMARGWIGPKDYRRDREGGLKPDRHREIGMSVLDSNAQLQGIIVDATRGAETDVARVQWLRSTYLAGSPRVTTNISDAYLATGSNTVNLPAQAVFGDPRTVLEEIASLANKQFFVTVDEELFYDGNDSTAYYSTLAINDRLVCDAPSPPDQIIDPLYTWDFEGGGAGTTSDTTATIDMNLSLEDSSFGKCPTGSGAWCCFNTASHRQSGIIANSGTTTYQLSGKVRWAELPSIRDIWITWAGTSTLRDMIVDGSDGYVIGPTYSFSAQFTVPAAQTGFQITYSQFAGMFVDNIVLSAVSTLPVVCFPPIWDVGPAASEDGTQLLSGLRLYWGPGQTNYVYVSDPVTRNSYAHYEEALYAPESITTAAAATTLATTILRLRQYEDRNINVSIGPLTAAEAVQVKYGQLIPIKARAIAFADDQYFIGRIRQLRWTTPVPGTFFAHMQIERPIKDVPYGVGNKSGAQAVNAHMVSGSNAHPDYLLRGILTTQGDLPYRGASDWTRLPIGGSNTVLKSLGTVPVWVTAAEGGVGVTGVGWIDSASNPDKPPGSPNAIDDEFDAGSLDAKWTQTGSSTLTFAGSRMAATVPSASEVSFTEAFVPGASTAFTIRAKFTGMTYQANVDYAGISVNDSGGTAIGECDIRFITAGIKFHKDNPGGAADATITIWWTTFYLELTRDASNNYTFRTSSDGIAWSTFGLAGGSSATAVAQLRFRFGGTAATTYKTGSIDWIRRTV